MSWYNTDNLASYGLNRKRGNSGVGEAFAALGNSMARFGEVQEQQEDKKRLLDKQTKIDLEQKNRKVAKATGIKEYLNKNGIDTTKMSDDDAIENYHLHKASVDDNHRRKLEDGMISAFERYHPKFMGVKNPDYAKMSREEKLGLIKLVGMEQNNKKSPKVVNVSTRDDGRRVAVFSDGTVSDLKFNAKDYQQAREKTVKSPKEKRVTINDIKMYEWAKKNPDNPLAKKILANLSADTPKKNPKEDIDNIEIKEPKKPIVKPPKKSAKLNLVEKKKRDKMTSLNLKPNWASKNGRW